MLCFRELTGYAGFVEYVSDDRAARVIADDNLVIVECEVARVIAQALSGVQKL